MTETRWVAYNKNNSEKPSHTEDLRFSEQWMQTAAQRGCHNYYILMFKKETQFDMVPLI